MAKRKKAPRVPKRLPPKWEVGDTLSNGWASGPVASVLETQVNILRDTRHRHPLTFYVIVPASGLPFLAEQASLVKIEI